MTPFIFKGFKKKYEPKSIKNTNLFAFAPKSRNAKLRVRAKNIFLFWADKKNKKKRGGDRKKKKKIVSPFVVLKNLISNN